MKRDCWVRLFHPCCTKPSTMQSQLLLRLLRTCLTQMIQGILASTQATSHAEHSPGLQHLMQRQSQPYHAYCPPFGAVVHEKVDGQWAGV